MSDDRGSKRSYDSRDYNNNKGGNYRGNEGRNYGRGGYRGRGGRGGYNNNNRGGYYKKEAYGRDPRDEARDAEEDKEREFERSDKRRKYEQPFAVANPIDDVETRIKSLIVRIGDKSTSSLQSNLVGLAAALEEDMKSHKDVILDSLFQCVLSLPVKTPVYGTLVGLLNVKNFEIGKECVLKTSNMLQDALEKNTFHEIKPLVRFIAELVNANVLLPSSIVDLFNQFLSAASNSDDNNKRADYFVHLVVQTLPWIGKELSERKPDDLAKIMETIDIYMSKRNSKGNPILHTFEADAREDQLSLLWKHISKLRAAGWDVRVTLRPYESLSSSLSSALAHSLSVLKLPNNLSTNFPSQKPIFRIYYEDDTEKDMTTIERLIMEDYLIDIMYHFNENHKECVKQMQSLPFTFSLDFLLIETIFSELLRLPNSTFKEIYYTCLIIDICKTQPSIGPALGKAIFLLFESLEKMDVECIDRFASWFSLHLSNFDFKWDWSIWDYILSNKEESSRVYFIKESIEKCIRLSYFERVQKTLPEDFQSFLPNKPAPNFKYDSAEYNTNKPYAAKVNVLLEKFKNKVSAEDILSSTIDSDEFLDFTTEEKLQIVVYSILKAGSKSFSHFLATVERYLPLLNHFTTTTEAKMVVLKEVKDFWALNPQSLIIQVDKLMSYTVIDNTTIIHWIFSASEQPNYTRGYIWEIIRNTINKTLARTETIEEELRSAESGFSKLPASEQTEDSMEGQRLKDRKTAFDIAQRELKELFLIIFQRFVMCLTEHISQSEANNADPNNFWFYITLGHLKAVGRQYHKNIQPFLSDTSFATLFSNVDARMSAVYKNLLNI